MSDSIERNSHHNPYQSSYNELILLKINIEKTRKLISLEMTMMASHEQYHINSIIVDYSREAVKKISDISRERGECTA